MFEFAKINGNNLVATPLSILNNQKLNIVKGILVAAIIAVGVYVYNSGILVNPYSEATEPTKEDLLITLSEYEKDKAELKQEYK